MSKKINKHQLTAGILTALLVIGAVPFLSSADTTTASKNGTYKMRPMDGSRKNRGFGIVGTVSSISGNKITLAGKDGTNYAIDATNAKITKGGLSITTSQIAIGDNLFVAGTVSGINVTATNIMDGIFKGFEDNGNKIGPGVIGTVKSISGNSIILTCKNGIDYSVDATSAKITKAGASITLSAIVVGDTLVVKGTVTGVNVVATAIVDGLGKPGMAFGKEGRNEMRMTNSIFGQIISIVGSSFTVQTRVMPKSATTTTEWTVTTDSNTKILKNGQAGTIGSLSAGQNVAVTGVKNISAQTIAANPVNIFASSSPKMMGRMMGWGKKGK